MPTKPPCRDEDYDSELTKYVNKHLYVDECHDVDEHLEDNGRFCARRIFLPKPVRERTGQLYDATEVAVSKDQKAHRDQAYQVAEHLLIRREENFFGQFIKPDIWARDVTGAADTDYAKNKVKKWASSNIDANPRVDITHLASEMARRQHGRRPNKICMARDVWDEFRNHPKILTHPRMSGINGDGPGTRRAAAELFEVNEVLIMEQLGIKKSFLFLFHQGAYSHLQSLSATAGVNFVWKPSNVDVEGADPWIRCYRAEGRNYVEARYSSYFEVVSKDCGTLIEDLV